MFQMNVENTFSQSGLHLLILFTTLISSILCDFSANTPVEFQQISQLTFVSSCLQLKDLQDKYSECEDMLHEAREDIKNLRNKSLPNSTVQRYTALTSVLPMDSLAAEIEGTFRKGLDNPAPSEYKSVSNL